jgi:thiamine-phosphate pyrophosphorylase
MDAVLLKTTELACAEMLAEAGVELIQYRNKSASSRLLFEISQSLASFFSPRGIRFIVNDRADIAALVNAGGVHVGQEDLSVEDARAVCGPDRWVGVSTHSLEQFRRAAHTSADYIAIGPIFATSTKANPDPVVGIEIVRQARKLTRKPIVAIGGITLDRATEVLDAGADSVAAAGDILHSPHAGNRAREFLDRIRAWGRPHP